MIESGPAAEGRRWEHFAHGADIGVRGYGDTPAQAFESAALALTAVVTSPAAVQARDTVNIRCQAPTLDFLLLDWLNALIYEMATRHMLFGDFRVAIDGEHLRGVALGETVDPGRHRPAVEIKGATLTELKVDQQADGRWLAQCVVDV
ncbi:archease [Thiohalobacter sp. IOR34]|uniref:archease n=1 Tax=Thiohalobacter sp. IOR34 TaxID=3057176 RepID=UPI0025B01695|nr:archease [Thiohalobacter sp. IOR34]WJW76633.1 archease [Thiohalobacter sp. IOR34]